MPNIRPLIARLVEMPPADREEFYWWMEGMTECGYPVPSGKELREKVDRKIRERLTYNQRECSNTRRMR